MSHHLQFEDESDTYAIYGAADRPRLSGDRTRRAEQVEVHDWLSVASEAAGALLAIFVPLIVVATLWCLLMVTR